MGAAQKPTIAGNTRQSWLPVERALKTGGDREAGGAKAGSEGEN